MIKLQPKNYILAMLEITNRAGSSVNLLQRGKEMLFFDRITVL